MKQRDGFELENYEAIRRAVFFLIAVVFFIIPVEQLRAEIKADQKNIPQEIGIDENLGGYIPLDLKFTDEHGNPVALKDLVDKPVVLSLVYFRCPGLCSPLLSGVVDVMDRVDLQPGKDFKAITVSFDETDTPQLATEKKKNYMHSFKKRNFPAGDWTWLTGDSASIHQLTDALGFKFKKVNNEFIHSSAIFVIAPDGKISRYLRGIEYLPFNLKMSIVEASQGKVGPTISKLLLYCFSYDPAGKTYVFNVLKVSGSALLMFIGAFVAFLTIKGRMKSKHEG